MRGPLDISRDLLTADVPHEFVRLPRRISTAEELPEVLQLPASACVSVRVFVADEAPVAVAMPAGAIVSLHSLRRVLAARDLRLAAAGTTSEATQFSAGLVAPLALPDGLAVLLDAALGLEPVLYTATGDGGTALKIRSAHLLSHARARVDAFSQPRPLLTPDGAHSTSRQSDRPHAGVRELGASAV